jgi:hypothetical protein
MQRWFNIIHWWKHHLNVQDYYDLGSDNKAQRHMHAKRRIS